MNDLMKNAEGYPDPTAGLAMLSTLKILETNKLLKESDERFHKLLNIIFDICELSGFHIENRITVKDKKTGKIYR